MSYKTYIKKIMETQNKQTLSQLLFLSDAEIRAAFVKGNSVNLLMVMQERLVVAPEEEISEFMNFMMKLNYACSAAKQDGRLDSVNTEAYMALVATANARITLLKHFREQQHKNIPLALASIAI